MPMGLVNDLEWESELPQTAEIMITNERVPVAKVEDIITPGRDTNDVNVPDVLRKVIGVTASESGRPEALRIAEGFGISSSSVSAYAVGATSTASYHKPEPSLSQFLKDRKVKITKRASSKLLSALNSITDEALEECRPTELAMVAKSLSSVVREMEPNSNLINESSGPTFVFYAPKLVTEEHFDTVTVKE